MKTSGIIGAAVYRPIKSFKAPKEASKNQEKTNKNI